MREFMIVSFVRFQTNRATQFALLLLLIPLMVVNGEEIPEFETLIASVALPEQLILTGELEYMDPTDKSGSTFSRERCVFQLLGERKHLFYEGTDQGVENPITLQIEMRIKEGQQLVIDFVPENKTGGCRGLLDVKNTDSPWYKYLGVASVLPGAAPWDDCKTFKSYFDEKLKSVITANGIEIQCRSEFGFAVAKFTKTPTWRIAEFSVDKNEGDLLGTSRGDKVVGRDFENLRRMECSVIYSQPFRSSEMEGIRNFEIKTLRDLKDGNVDGSAITFNASEVIVGANVANRYSEALLSPLPVGFPVTVPDSESGLAYMWDGNEISLDYSSYKLVPQLQFRSQFDSTRS